MLEKTRILWESFGRPNAEDENCTICLRSMPTLWAQGWEMVKFQFCK